MKRFFLLLVLIMVCGNLAFAQKNNVDSLTKAYKKTKQDSTLVHLLISKAGFVYLSSNRDSAMICLKQALALSRKIHFKIGEVRALAGIATELNRNGDLPGSLRMTFAVLPQAIAINDSRTVSQCYNTLGLTYSTLKDYKKSLYNYLKAKAIVEKSNMPVLMVTLLNNISRSYLDMNNIDSALYYTQKAYTLALKAADENIGFLIRNFGIIQFKKGNNEQALVYYNKSIKTIPHLDNHYLLSEDYRRIGEVYQRINKPDSCILYAKEAYEQAKLDKDPEQVMRATALLTDVFRSTNNFKEAFTYQQIMVNANDSLFSEQKTLQIQNLSFDEQQRNDEIEAAKIDYQNKVRMYVLAGIIGVFILIVFILFNNNLRRKKANNLLQQRNEQIENQHKAIEKTLAELKTTQTQLIQSEKMASLGELTAGIAHEIQNPLNFVNNFSEVNTELIAEMQDGIDKGKFDDVKAIANDIKENQLKISQHGKRADFIVKGMLQHSRTNTGERQLTNINTLADEFLKLSYHGLRAKDKSFNSELVTHFDENLPKVNVVQQDIGRVLLNLFNNAFYAVKQKKKTAGEDYKPTVEVITFAPPSGGWGVKVKDNGTGIPDGVKEKIMQPFFTTKPTGEGTGLGLSLSYDIVVKGHGASINIISTEGIGSEFIISIPVNS